MIVRHNETWWVISEVTGGSMYAGRHDERRRSPVQETEPDSEKLRCGKGIIELIQCKAAAYDRMRQVTGGSMYAGHHDERRRSPVQETKPDSDKLRCGKGIIELIQCKAAAYDRMRRGGCVRSDSVRQDDTWWVVSEVTGGSMYAGHHDERRRSPVQDTKLDSEKLRCGKGCNVRQDDTWWVVSEVTGESMYAGHHDERRRSLVHGTKPGIDELYTTLVMNGLSVSKLDMPDTMIQGLLVMEEVTLIANVIHDTESNQNKCQNKSFNHAELYPGLQT
ncbi:hypothetical protein J6590_056548 [Homalodisca vitripennis]|nr:hypothetical protein J6590_056548 [Homalodisca vitripennis]